MKTKRGKCAAPKCSRYTSGAYLVTVSWDGHSRPLHYCTRRHMEEAVARIVL